MPNCHAVASVACLALACGLLTPLAHAESAVKEIGFTDLVDASGDRVALFYFSSEALQGPVLEVMEQAAAALHPSYPSLKWNKVDGDASEENAAEFESAPFKKGRVYLFTTTTEAGIEQYPQPLDELTVDTLVRYLNFKLSPISDHQRSLVHVFKSEKKFKALGSPVLVKFYKQSCPHCIHYVGTFQRAAGHFEGKVKFLEVDCIDGGKKASAFCGKHGVNSYPTLMLFDGDTTHKLTDERSIPGLEKWFKKVLPKVFPDSDDAPTPATPAIRSTADESGDAVAASDAVEEAAKETPTPTPKPSKSKGKKQKKGNPSTAAADTAAGSTEGSLVQDISFKSLVAASGSRVALFFFTSDGLHDKVLALLEETAKGLASTFPDLRWNKVDGDASEENAAEFKSAPFEKGAVYLFLTTAEAGIERIPTPVDELTVAGLTRYLGFKLSPISDHQRSLVHVFKSEKKFKALGSPVLVKFYKQSCPHCIHYVGTFQRAAGHFEGKVKFLEVDCVDGGKKAEAFCGKHGVNSFPTLMLFDGKGTHKLTTDRSIPGLEKWFKEVLPEVFPDSGDAATATPAPTPEPTTATAVAGDSSTAGSFGGASRDTADAGAEATPAPSPTKDKASKGKGKKGPIKDISFKSLVAATGNRMALFYFASDGLHDQVLPVLEETAKALKSTYPDLLWNKVDGEASEENAKEFEGATFKKGSLHLFLTTAEAGIEQYPDPVSEVTVAGLTRYLGFKLSPISDHQRSLVHVFKSEKKFKALGSPVLVKFYKQSCPHCIHYVGTFQRAAGHFEGKVKFLEVDCVDGGKKAEAFCGKHGVNSFPTLMLFDGKGTHKLTTDRSIPGLEKWFKEVLPEVFPDSGTAATASDASGVDASTGSADLDTEL